MEPSREPNVRKIQRKSIPNRSTAAVEEPDRLTTSRNEEPVSRNEEPASTGQWSLQTRAALNQTADEVAGIDRPLPPFPTHPSQFTRYHTAPVASRSLGTPTPTPNPTPSHPGPVASRSLGTPTPAPNHTAPAASRSLGTPGIPTPNHPAAGSSSLLAPSPQAVESINAQLRRSGDIRRMDATRTRWRGFAQCFR